jgi:hypothetical protein
MSDKILQKQLLKAQNRLNNYTAKNGNIIPGQNGATTLPPGGMINSWWNDIMPDTDSPTANYVPSLPLLGGPQSKIVARWMDVTRAYNNKVSAYNKANDRLLRLLVLSSLEENKKVSEKIKDFLRNKKIRIQSKLDSAKTRLVRVAYWHNEKILNLQALISVLQAQIAP